MKKCLVIAFLALAGLAHAQGPAFVPPTFLLVSTTDGTTMNWVGGGTGSGPGYVPKNQMLAVCLVNTALPVSVSNLGWCSFGSSGGGFTAGGDLSGSSTSQTVIGINDTLLSGLATGPLCNTTTTGVPSACNLASFTALGLAPLASPAFTGTPTVPTAAVGTNTTQAASTAFVANQIAAVPVSSTFVAGDTICALGGDTTIGQATITGGSSTSSVITIIVAGVQQRFFPGQLIGVIGVTPSGFNVASVASASVTIAGTTTITFASANNPGAWVSGGTVYIPCSNSTDAITNFTNFANSYTIPTAFVAGSHLRAVAQGVSFTSALNPAVRYQWSYGSTLLFTTAAGGLAPSAGNPNGTVPAMFSLETSSVSANVLNIGIGGNIGSTQVIGSSLLQNPIPITSAANTALNIGVLWLATGVASGTYTSGITPVGTVGQTCTLTAFNNGSTATATVALTGTNVIAGGTTLVITARGASATAAPTAATAGNGTATCTGTATIATVLGGIAGNAIELLSMTP